MDYYFNFNNWVFLGCVSENNTNQNIEQKTTIEKNNNFSKINTTSTTQKINMAKGLGESGRYYFFLKGAEEAENYAECVAINQENEHKLTKFYVDYTNNTSKEIKVHVRALTGDDYSVEATNYTEMAKPIPAGDIERLAVAVNGCYKNAIIEKIGRAHV